MLDGLAKEEVDDFLEDHPTIIPLFEIDVITAIGSPPVEDVTEDSPPQDEPDPTTIAELRHARDVFDCKLSSKKILNKNCTDWDEKLQSALWAYCTTFKTNIQSTPFRMTFVLEAVMPIEFQANL